MRNPNASEASRLVVAALALAEVVRVLAWAPLNRTGQVLWLLVVVAVALPAGAINGLARKIRLRWERRSAGTR